MDARWHDVDGDYAADRFLHDGRKRATMLWRSAGVAAVLMVGAGITYGATASPWALVVFVSSAVGLILAGVAAEVDRVYTLLSVAENRARIIEYQAIGISARQGLG